MTARKRADGWIPVGMRKPYCPRSVDRSGTPVLIWPTNLVAFQDTPLAYYGRRITGHPEFYYSGAVLFGVTHWMPLPKGPTK